MPEKKEQIEELKQQLQLSNQIASAQYKQIKELNENITKMNQEITQYINRIERRKENKLCITITIIFILILIYGVYYKEINEWFLYF